MRARVSIESEGAAAARLALERTIGGGGIAIFPADGLYGLACDPVRPEAVSRINEIKGRDPAKPSAVMYFSPLAMREMLVSVGPRTRDAIGALLPGPVTLVVANPEGRYPLACGADPTRLGLRLIDGPLTGTMVPLLQTSANRAGDEPPASVEQLDPEIAAAADLVIDGGRLGGEPSTVVDVSGIEAGEGWRVLRQGALASEELRGRLGR